MAKKGALKSAILLAVEVLKSQRKLRETAEKMLEAGLTDTCKSKKDLEKIANIGVDVCADEIQLFFKIIDCEAELFHDEMKKFVKAELDKENWNEKESERSAAKIARKYMMCYKKYAEIPPSMRTLRENADKMDEIEIFDRMNKIAKKAEALLDAWKKINSY